ncbi:MAG: lytic murein transglycosylase [Candidatus Pacebacteria bacterium]|nr:lytic murein transglycosylase [Candidatus Paceibacterota bacterium]MBP9866854.1 lytic murein transglycosylase [Candidatus Paceibacterota bacterium]
MRKYLAIFFVVFSIFSFQTNGFLLVHAEQTRADLEADLANLEAQIKALNGTIAKTKEQGASLKNDITLLSQKIDQSKLKIQSHDKAIKRINGTISEKNRTINVLDEKLEREKESLSQILRKTRYLEQYSVLDFGLQSESLSTFFSDADSFSTLNKALAVSFSEIEASKNNLEKAKTELEEVKDEEVEKKLAQELEKKKVETNQKEKNTLLSITKNKETEYKKVLATREKEAAQIRARLFELRDTGSISFGQAYDFALASSKSTGIRPALILAILMQESSLGINVGACYLRDYATGDGVGIKSGETKKRTMHPDRDVPVFLSFLKKLGRDPQKTPVSCWIPMYSKGNPTGWGGAMGPSQFIPSTWTIFEKRIEKITGSSVADPWKPYHAITATSLYLADLGAVAGNEASERNAACKYYSGRACSASSAGAGYGNSVMKKVTAMQADIDKLQK